MAALLDDSEIHGWVEAATELTVAAAPAADDADDDGTSGVVDGAAGGLAALLAVHRATGSPEAWRGARLYADRLTDRPLLPAAPGFASGAAGVGWALLRFAAADGGAARYQRVGLAALRSAAHAATRAADPATAGAVPGPSWCRGLPGIALAIADSAAALAEPDLAELARRTGRAVAEDGPLPDHSLCHGETGALELLARLADPAVQTALADRTAALTALLDRSGPRCGTPGGLATPGLLTGLSGIGHGLLRLGFPERTASALLLQPPSPPRPSPPTP